MGIDIKSLRLDGLKTPGIRLARWEFWVWILLCAGIMIILSLGANNGVGVFHQPEQDLFLPVLLGCITNGLILYLLGIRVVPYFFLKKRHVKLLGMVLLVLVVATFIKAFLDFWIIQLRDPELMTYPFTVLIEENLYATSFMVTLGSAYGVVKTLVYKSHLPSDEEMVIRSGKKIYRFKKGDIDYFEAQGNYVKVVGQMKSELLYTSLSKLEKQMDERYFIRIHRSYIVSVRNATQIGTHHLAYGETEIPVSDKYKKGLQAWLSGKHSGMNH